FRPRRWCRPQAAWRCRSPSCCAAGPAPAVPLPPYIRLCSAANKSGGWLRRACMYSRFCAGRGAAGGDRPQENQGEKTHSMARLVMKFGGTSVADLDRIRAVAQRVKREVDAGHEVAVVVSAMAGATNQLVDWVRGISVLHDAREYDVVVASGEQVTAGLTALALQEVGVPARSWLGWQLPLRTDSVHGKARIE